jgi:hypothetical protein
MAEASEIQRDIQQLEAELRRLEAEYNMFFAGRLPRPPWETRGRVQAIIKRWDRGHIDSAIEKFRFTTLQSRFATFAELWDRGMRAREEGRPGPFAHGARRREEKKAEPEAARILYVAAFTDPVREHDKLCQLYESLMDARREVGADVVPFHKFADLVRAQVQTLKAKGSPEVAFRVAVAEGKVNFTVRALKGPAE